MWKVIIDYDAACPAEVQGAVDVRLDQLADAAGDVLDSGSGSGFGRRDLDYAFGSEAEAQRLLDAVESAFSERSDLDLSVCAARLDEAMDA